MAAKEWSCGGNLLFKYLKWIGLIKELKGTRMVIGEIVLRLTGVVGFMMI